IRNWHEIIWNKWKTVGVIIEAIIFAVILYAVVKASMPTIQAMLNTVYPGKRQSTGGGNSLYRLFTPLVSLIFPYSSGIPNSNVVESSAFIDFLPISIIMSLYIMIKEKRARFLDVYLLAVIAMFIVYSVYGLPLVIAKVLGLTLTTSGRIVIAVSVSSIVLLVRNMHTWYQIASKRDSYILLAFFVIVSLYSAHISYADYLGHKKMLVFVVILAIISLGMLLPIKTARTFFAICTLLGIIVSGLSVNPIQYGAQAINNQPIVNSAKALNSSKDVWAVAGVNSAFYANLFVANGIRTLNPVAVTPNLKLWHKVDPQKKYDEVYNRYAYINVEVVPKADSKKFNLDYPDRFTVRLTADELHLLGVTHIASTNSIDTRNVHGQYRLKEIGSPVNNMYYYEIIHE
ncbi:MAG: hypothetical protein Q3961_02210, partial [Bifidobacteriaceae bacterium]|nr:hypothetical protein [Bifidobacteriaceae bacterium]